MAKFLPLLLMPLFLVAILGAHPNLFKLSENNSTDPFCDVMDEYYMIGCYLIDQNSTDVMTNAFENAMNWEGISFLLAFSAVGQLPTDILTNNPITSLTFDQNCTLQGIPSTLLRGVSSPLTNLEFINVLGLSSVLTGDLDNTGFSSSLESLVFLNKELKQIEDSSFQEFTNLKTLTISQTSIQQLQSNTLQGLTGLEEVTLTYNPITTIPSGFFAEQNLLKNIWLGQNQLESLESGSLDGLGAVQMLNVAGNPFNCICSLQWFKDWLTVRDLLEDSGATCATPTIGKFSDVDFCA